MQSERSDFLTPAQRHYSRREFVRNTSLSVLGLGLAEFLALEAQARPTSVGQRFQPQAKNVLVLLEQGGVSHMDTWDPKPEQAADHRTPFKTIKTNVPGIEFSELLAKTAKIADKLAIIRGMKHRVSDHPGGTAQMLRGNKRGGARDYPDLGSMVSRMIGSECDFLPSYIMVPGNSEQAYNASSGFLPASYATFKTQGRDLSDPKWRVRGLQPATDEARFARRRRLLDNIDDHFVPAAANESVDALAKSYEQAFSALTSPQARAAFDFTTEPRRLKEEYGMGHRGFCYLLGRKLIEAEVRFVTVDVRWPKSGVSKDGANLNWDHHDLIYTKGSCGSIRNKCGGEGRYGIATWPMMGSLDQGFAALIRDMDDRGLLEETLVCWITEFGRTPTINRCQGRDHWTNAYTIVMAGAGVPGGQVIGATDKIGGEVVDQPHTPQDYAETIYRKLGIDTEKQFERGDGFRFPFTEGGKPIPELF